MNKTDIISKVKNHFMLIVFFAVLFLLIFLRSYVFGIYIVPSESMLSTLQVGDMLFGNKLEYVGDNSPEEGDIITFISPENSSNTLVKRVVATEGQTIDIEDGKLTVDGKVVDEGYVRGSTNQLIDYDGKSYIKYPYTVPTDCVFVMGDNRENSRDSRVFGAVNVSLIQSKIKFIYFPFDRAGSVY